MAGLLLGLEIIFYLYPIGLIVTLFSSQLISHRHRDVDNARAVDEKAKGKLGRTHAVLTWCLQLLLAPLLVCITSGLIKCNRTDALL